MTPAARLSAAIEVLSDIETARRPASDALKEWGLKRRFAGSSDRAAIAGLVYDALRRKASSAFIMDEATPRANLLGMLALERGYDIAQIEKLCDGARFAPEPLTPLERHALTDADLSKAPPHIAGDYPEWLDPLLTKVFGEARVDEGAALSSRAPLDLRVNTLKGTPEEAVALMPDLDAQASRWSPDGLRIEQKAEAKNPAIHAEPAFIKGLIEIQDEGSQLAALFAGAKPGEQVIDLCAGAGGKTLALAAAMDNKGQIFATDTDKRRLAPIHARLERAGARNVQVRTPENSGNELDRPERQDRSCADRRALHRHRIVAAQSGCEMAAAARRARNPPQGASRRCLSARCRWSKRAGASLTSRVRCWTMKTARRCATS